MREQLPSLITSANWYFLDNGKKKLFNKIDYNKYSYCGEDDKS